jgi:hypothetical protein
MYSRGRFAFPLNTKLAQLPSQMHLLNGQLEDSWRHIATMQRSLTDFKWKMPEATAEVSPETPPAQIPWAERQQEVSRRKDEFQKMWDLPPRPAKHSTRGAPPMRAQWLRGLWLRWEERGLPESSRNGGER